eukprot:TRINITY_DN21001_c0_g1_i1.p1 TRINITY_DN21001_c0_g1~~TRINITY_DN21001_c0_g1_i1.p1  ORF type:complete len:844 (+),score=93.22 TRINITY_DN21001_c0_g1_i1:202-2733(+)
MAWYDGGLILGAIINVVVFIVVLLIAVALNNKPRFRRHFRKRLYNREPGQEQHPSDPSEATSWFPFKILSADQLLIKCGGDGAFMLLVLKYTLVFFAIGAPFAGALIAINATDTYGYQYYKENVEDYPDDFEWQDGVHQWTIINITPKSNRLWAHWGVSVLMDFGLWFLVYKIFRAYIFCHQASESHPAMIRTMMIFHTSHLNNAQEWVETYVPNDLPIVAVHIPHKEPKKFHKRIEKRAQLLGSLEDLHYDNEEYLANTGNQPEQKKKFVLKKCKKVDAMEYWENELAKVQIELRPQIDEFLSNPAAGVVFLTFQTPEHCVTFSKFLQQRKKIGLISGVFAPHPREVRWTGLHMNTAARWMINLVVLILFLVLLFTWTIPVAFLSNLDNLSKIEGVGKAFDAILGLNPQISTLIAGNLPLIVMVVFNIVLEIIFVKATEFQNPHTTGIFDAMCYRKLFTFKLCAYVFFQALFVGGLQGIPALVRDFTADKALQMVASSVAPVLPLFTIVLLNGTGIAASIFMLQPAPLILGYIKSRKLSENDHRRLYRAWKPKPLKFWKEYTKILFGVSIGILFALTAPLMVILAVPYCLAWYMVNQYLFTEFWPYYPTSSLRIAHSIMHSYLMMNTLRQLGMMGIFVAREKMLLLYLYIPMAVLNFAAHIACWWAIRNTRVPANGTRPMHIPPDLMDAPVEEENHMAVCTGYQHPHESFRLDSPVVNPAPVVAMLPPAPPDEPDFPYSPEHPPENNGWQAPAQQSPLQPHPHSPSPHQAYAPQDYNGSPGVENGGAQPYQQQYNGGYGQPEGQQQHWQQPQNDRSADYMVSELNYPYSPPDQRPLPRESYV